MVKKNFPKCIFDKMNCIFDEIKKSQRSNISSKLIFRAYNKKSSAFQYHDALTTS